MKRDLMWIVLVVLAMTWSGLTVASVYASFWLDPYSGIFGCLGCLVIAVSLAVARRRP